MESDEDATDRIINTTDEISDKKNGSSSLTEIKCVEAESVTNPVRSSSFHYLETSSPF